MARVTRGRNWIGVFFIAFALSILRVLAAEEAQPSSSPPATDSSYRQVKFITPAEEDSGLKLSSFCLTKDGRIVAVLHEEAEQGGSGGVLSKLISAISEGGARSSGDNDAAKSGNSSSDKPQKSPGHVRLLDADGKLLDKWPVDFKAQAVNICPNGDLIIGGDGVLALYDLKGKQLCATKIAALGCRG